MMGYTHAAIGAAGAAAVARFIGIVSPQDYIIAVTSGVIGGVLVDIDVRNRRTVHEKITDAGRTRWAMSGLIVVCLLLDYFLKYGILQGITERKNTPVIGLVLLGAVLFVARMIRGHRTFSHSLLFVFLTTIGIHLIYPAMTFFYLTGSLLHVFVDLLNNPVPGSNDDWNKKHGIWLLYPIKGKGISFGICKAGGIGNKIFYFAGVISYLIFTGIYCLSFGEGNEVIPIAIVTLYLLVVLHLVRKESENELQGKSKRRNR